MSDRPRKIEHYEKRFGIIAIEKGFITKDELIDALRIQVKEDIKKGTHRLMGEILASQDKMTARQIEDVLAELFKRKRLV